MCSRSWCGRGRLLCKSQVRPLSSHAMAVILRAMLEYGMIGSRCEARAKTRWSIRQGKTRSRDWWRSTVYSANVARVVGCCHDNWAHCCGVLKRRLRRGDINSTTAEGASARDSARTPLLLRAQEPDSDASFVSSVSQPTRSGELFCEKRRDAPLSQSHTGSNAIRCEHSKPAVSR